MTRANISDLIYFLLRQNSANSDIVASTEMVNVINYAYNQVMNDLLPDNMTTSQVTAIHRTTRASGSSTTLVVADITGFAANTWAIIYEGTRYEVVRVTNADAPTKTLTLRSPGVVYTSFTTAAVVAPLSYIVTTTRDILTVLYKHIDQTYNDIYPLVPITKRTVFEQGMLVDSYSTLTSYALLTPTEVFIYPIPQYEGYLEVYYNANAEYSLAAAETVPSIDTQHHMLIVYYGLMLCLIREGEIEKAVTISKLYEALLINARNDLNRKYADSAPFDLERKI